MSAPHIPMMNDEGLLECPFCGECSYGVFLAQSDAGWCVACAKCEAATGDYFKKHHAVKAWNTRNGHLYTADDFNQAAEERDHGL